MAFIRKEDLEYEVSRLNKKYCKNTKHELRVQGAYGGYQVQLTGKRRKDGKGWRGYIGSGAADMTRGFQNPRSTLKELMDSDSKGELKRRITYWEKSKRVSRRK